MINEKCESDEIMGMMEKNCIGIYRSKTDVKNIEGNANASPMVLWY